MDSLKVILPVLAVILIFIAVCLFCSIHITVAPTVFECGTDYYAVVWATSLKGSGYVKYTYEGKEKVIWDEQGGNIVTDDTIHVVKVPKEELTNNTYKVVSQYVLLKAGYQAYKGKTTESDEIHFSGSEKEDDIRVLCISDVHEMKGEMKAALSYFTETPDIICMIGDISSQMITKQQFKKHLLSYTADISSGSIPVVYARGNHETRGEFASQMIEYFPTKTGEFYFTFDFGELSVLVFDSGEDKEDDHREYDGLVDFSSYRKQQLKWLKALKTKNIDGKYKIVLCHDPLIDTDFFGKDWETPLKKLSMDIVIGGHHHESKFVGGELPRFVDCGKYEDENGKTKWAASMVTLKDGRISMLTVNNEGETLLEEVIEVELSMKQ